MRHLLCLLLLASSVAAGEDLPDTSDVWRTVQNIDLSRDYHVDTLILRYDTARYYAKVDTVIVCSCGGDTVVCPPLRDGHPWPDCGSSVHVSLRYDTIWLPKVQVWLTPAQLDKLGELPE